VAAAGCWLLLAAGCWLLNFDMTTTTHKLQVDKHTTMKIEVIVSSVIDHQSTYFFQPTYYPSSYSYTESLTIVVVPFSFEVFQFFFMVILWLLLCQRTRPIPVHLEQNLWHFFSPTSGVLET
jgi:membrane-associated HD superfamily phosphohydrolase